MPNRTAANGANNSTSVATDIQLINQQPSAIQALRSWVWRTTYRYRMARYSRKVAYLYAQERRRERAELERQMTAINKKGGLYA